MNRQRILAAGIIALWALSVQGAVPATLPTIEVQFSPTSPTSADTLALALSGTWPNACVPQTFLVQVVPGGSIRIDLLLPGWDSKDGCEPPLCLQVLTPWQLTGAIPALSAGSYDVFIRAMDCEEASSYRQVTTLTVTPGVGGPLSDFFAPGERIVLLESDPPGGLGLAAGQAGTVICCDSEDCSGSLLVSWDLWADGKLELIECANGHETLYAPNSAIWINPNRVHLGRHFNQCGTIRKDLEGCISFEADDGRTYNVIAWPGLYSTLEGHGAIQFDDRVRLQGLLNTTPPGPDELRLCLQHDGDIFHPTLTLCSPADAEPEPKPEPEPGPDSIVISIAGNPLVLQQTPSSPGTYSGCANITIELNFRAQLSVAITPAAGVGGTWTGTLDPDVLGPGTVTTELCVEVVDLDISSLPPGKDVQVATVTLLAAPAL